MARAGPGRFARAIRCLLEHVMARMDVNRRQGGFTLVELLVVISIIAVLVSLLLPALGRARDVAQDVKCKSNQRQLALMVFLYQNDHEGPPGFNTAVTNYTKANY